MHHPGNPRTPLVFLPLQEISPTSWDNSTVCDARKTDQRICHIPLPSLQKLGNISTRKMRHAKGQLGSRPNLRPGHGNTDVFPLQRFCFDLARAYVSGKRRCIAGPLFQACQREFSVLAFFWLKYCRGGTWRETLKVSAGRTCYSDSDLGRWNVGINSLHPLV